MRREIAVRAAGGILYGVTTYAGLVVSRRVEPFWAGLAIVVGMTSLAGFIHWSALRVYERRNVPPVPEQ